MCTTETFRTSPVSCEICEDATLLAKEIARACKTKKIATDPRTIVEENSCDTNSTVCMQGQCNICSSTGLNPSDFNDSDVESDSEDESINVQYINWVKNENGYLTKQSANVSVHEAKDTWNKKVAELKTHIFTKRQQSKHVQLIKENLKTTELLIQVDYSENYKNRDQDEIQTAYFGQEQFSLFTA